MNQFLLLVDFHLFFKIIKTLFTYQIPHSHFDGLVQERHNSSALAMELRLSCINPSIWQSQGVTAAQQLLICHYGSTRLRPWFIQKSANEIQRLFHDLSRTFLSSNGRNYPGKKKCTKIYPDSSWLRHIPFTMINLWITHTWKAWKIFAHFLIATYLKIVVKRHMIIIYEKHPTVYKLIFFNDFHWFAMTFPG